MVSEQDLERALESQAAHGGRLGTSLVELPLASEEQVAEALQELLETRVATEELLSGASRAALGQVSPEFARRHGVIPIDVQDEQLTAALLDPTDPIVVDELAFATGAQVVPMLELERRFREALEAHYGIATPHRRAAQGALPDPATTTEMPVASRPESAPTEPFDPPPPGRCLLRESRSHPPRLDRSLHPPAFREPPETSRSFRRPRSKNPWPARRTGARPTCAHWTT